MKLVQLLAKELKEWPESAKYITQEDDDGSVTLWYRAKPKYKSGEWVLDRHLDDSDYAYILHGIDTASDNKTSIVTQDQWQVEREKMNKPKWIRHRGGKCPVKAGTKVVTRYRDGLVSDWCMTRQQDAGEECLSAIWSHSGGEEDIMAYYVEETKEHQIKQVKVTDVKLEMMQGDSWVTIGSVSSDFGASVFDGGQPPKGEEVKKTNFGTITYNIEIDATGANKELDSLVAKWGQIESPLKWRDEIIELEACEEEFRREREKLIRKLESEGFKLIDHMAPVYGDQIIDMSDCRNWKTGDVIEIVANEAGHKFENGEEVIVAFLDLNDTVLTVNAEYKDGSDYWWLSGKDAKFIRRP